MKWRKYDSELENLSNIAALKMRIGFWGMLYYKYTKEPPQNSIGNY